MYLLINGERFSVSRRIFSTDTIKYLSVSPEPKNVSGTIQMYTDEDFLLSEDNADSFAKKEYVGTLLTITNAPEPISQPYIPTDTDVLNKLLGVI